MNNSILFYTAERINERYPNSLGGWTLGEYMVRADIFLATLWGNRTSIHKLETIIR